MELILIIGLPNAGKTTYSKQFKNVLHLDDFPWNKFLNCNEAVRLVDDDVVIDGIYNLRCRRERLLEAVRDKSEKKVCIWVDTPLEECIKRSVFGRSERIVRDGARMFQPPTYDEGWDEIIIVKDGKETLLPRQEV